MAHGLPRTALALALLGMGVAACGPGSDKPPGKSTGVDSDTGTQTTDTGMAPLPGEPVQIEASDPVACADPSARDELLFDQVVAPPEPDKQSWFWGGGVIVSDFTGDDRLDIVLPGYHGTEFFTQQPNGTYLPDPRLDGLDLGLASGGTAADYDGDGDLDLLITRFLAPDRLLRNDGGTFVDVSSEAGLSTALRRSMSSAWADYDGDGDLDLFVGSYGFIDESGTQHSDFEPADPSFLYRNEGDGTFTDLSDQLPQVVHDGYTFVGSWLDLDRDGLPELHLVNDFGVATPNQVLLNRGGGTLELDDGSLGLMLDITGMGLAIGDINGDGLFDFAMPEWNGIIVMESTESGFWVRTNFARGIYNDITVGQKVGWGAEFTDLDNDGDLDLPVVFGYLDTEIYDAPQDEPDALFEQASDGKFTDQRTAWGFDHTGDGRGFVVADLDGNGWLDVVKRDLQGPTTLMRGRCGTEHWVRVRLRQDGANRFAVGAQVRVFTEGQAQIRPLLAGGQNHASGGPPEVHFGLADAERIDRLEILWPDGSISNVWDLDVDRTLTVTRE